MANQFNAAECRLRAIRVADTTFRNRIVRLLNFLERLMMFAPPKLNPIPWRRTHKKTSTNNRNFIPRTNHELVARNRWRGVMNPPLASSRLFRKQKAVKWNRRWVLSIAVVINFNCSILFNYQLGRNVDDIKQTTRAIKSLQELTFSINLRSLLLCSFMKQTFAWMFQFHGPCGANGGKEEARHSSINLTSIDSGKQWNKRTIKSSRMP